MPKSQTLEFVNNFVSLSRKFKQPYVTTWREVIQNFIVEPTDNFNYDSVSNPYGKSNHRGRHQRHTAGARHRGIVLKDGETHKAIMTYASRLVTTILGDARGEYVIAEPVGYEDALGKGRTTTRLLRYCFAQPGIFRTMIEAVVDMLLMGTSIVFIPWRYRETEMPMREVSVNEFGEEVDTFTRHIVTAVDDPSIECVDNEDFFPDPTECRLDRMVGVARKFRMNGNRAKAKAKAGLFRTEAVERAIRSASGGEGTDEDEFREDQPDREDQRIPSGFNRMVGYEYWGEVPWEPKDGSRRRKITCLNNEVVEDRPWPLADPDLPFRELVINPVSGRFYGVSPGEVIRYDQDLQDVVRKLLAEAIIRQVHPPLLYNSQTEIDLGKLRNWRPNTPIGVNGPPGGSIETLSYDANVFNGFAEVNALKTSMQETSGATASIQGQGLGTKRASATEAKISAENSMARPELGAMLLEREAMPSIARSIIRRYQQFITSEQLSERVGESPRPMWVGDIMGDFDVQFMGSRRAISRQEKLQSYDRLVAISAAIPAAQMVVPWHELLRSMIGDVLELPEVAAKMADPMVVQQNAMLSQLGAAQSGNGNGTSPAAEPAGMISAQASGGTDG